MIDVLVLAAGQSSRMREHHKILLPTEDGHSVLSLLLSKLLNCSFGKIVVVLGRDAQKVKASVLSLNLENSEQLSFITNPDFQDGMSTSLKLGISLFTSNNNGLAIFLADQPLLSESDISTLLEAYVHKPNSCLAVAAAKGGKRLNPVIFSPELLRELQQASGDVGAKGILKQYKAQTSLVDLGDGLWCKDIDDWEGYVELARAVNWQDALDFINSQG